MRKRDIERRLTGAVRKQKHAQDEVRAANALVTEATSRLPPHYVDERHRFKPGERERIQDMINRAQKASDRLGAATADVVGLRALLASMQKR